MVLGPLPFLDNPLGFLSWLVASLTCPAPNDPPRSYRGNRIQALPIDLHGFFLCWLVAVCCYCRLPVTTRDMMLAIEPPSRRRAQQENIPPPGFCEHY